MGEKKASYFIATNIFLKGISFIYFIAFLICYHNWDALLGSEGLTPVHLHVGRIKGIFLFSY
jgi:hypothetical protein